MRETLNTIFFAEENGKTVGLIFCNKYIWDDGYHFFIEEMAVHSDYRRKGLGRKLAEKIEETARENKIAVIDLFAHTEANAFNFWNSLGYSKTDFVLMKKKL